LDRHISILVVSAVTIVFLFTTTTNGLKLAYANTNPLTDKEEFDVVVMGISHTDILVSVAIDGQTQKYTIHHNPSFISAPTVQQIVFKFARNFGATPPTALPIKTGDIWFACIKYPNTQSSCGALPVTSLTQPQKQALDARYIPGQSSGLKPSSIVPFS
jgi:hypothetical protein